MEVTNLLRAAIENLYTIFSAYPTRDDTNACACCHSPEDEKRLYRKLLHKINSGDLRQYATDALFVWGDVTDFRHFLPRVFELAVADGDDFVDPQVVLNKLYEGDWRSWSDAEQPTVEHFLDALWRCVLDSQPHESYGEEIEDWLCGIAQAVDHVSPYLKTWLSAEAENARLNLAVHGRHRLREPETRPSGYREGRTELFSEVAAW